MEELLGSEAEAIQDFEHRGQVKVHSEIWQAVSDTPVQRGQRLKVTGIEGLVRSGQPLATTHKEKNS